VVGSPVTVEVSDGVYAYIQPDGSWYINNTGFITGGGGVISIDTCSTARRTRAYLDAVARVTGRPVRTLVNTHHHGDHTYGNCLLPQATIVGHERCRDEVLASGPPANLGIWTDVEWGDLEPAPPFLTYDSGVTLWAGDLRCEVRYVGTPAHTTNDSIVHIPERSVLYAGDLVLSGGTPFLLMGSIAGAIEVLEDVVRPLGAQVIVPGHGPVRGPELIDEADLGDYAGLLDPERLPGNLHRAYAELDGAERGAPVDLIAALQDMITYNGGRPLSCHA
jgi:cyclase